MTSAHSFGEQPVRIGVDFGPATTVLAVAVPGEECVTLAVPNVSFEAGCPPVNVIPSLVQYEGGEVIRFGDEVARAGAEDGPATARWMRRNLCDMSPVQLPAGNGRTVRCDEAARDFFSCILTPALRQYPGAALVFALPGGAPPAYAELLHKTALAAGAASVSFTAEELAAAAGCSFIPGRSEPFLLIAFTASGMEATALVPDGEMDSSSGGMRVLGRAGVATGCRAVDTWLMQDLLNKFRLLECDDRAIRLRPRLMYEAGTLRMHLAYTPAMSVSITDDVSGRSFTAAYTAADVTRVLEAHGVTSALTGCIDRAFSAMRLRGADPDRIRTVLLTGEGCMLPGVQDAVLSHLPGRVVCGDHPLDAIARGAALAAAPAKAPDRITRSYALRYRDATANEHHYRYIVHAGTRYPSAGQVARVVISAAYDGQAHLGIPLYEIGNGHDPEGPAIELVSDSGGGVRVAGPVQDAGETGRVVHANERTPTLLAANPPARKGEPRFECTFTIDAERTLCLSARDLVTGALVKVNAPVHRLT